MDRMCLGPAVPSGQKGFAASPTPKYTLWPGLGKDAKSPLTGDQPHLSGCQGLPRRRQRASWSGVGWGQERGLGSRVETAGPKACWLSQSVADGLEFGSPDSGCSSLKRVECPAQASIPMWSPNMPMDVLRGQSA